MALFFFNYLTDSRYQATSARLPASTTKNSGKNFFPSTFSRQESHPSPPWPL